MTNQAQTISRIKGVKYAVEIDGTEYVAAWKSPYRVSLFDRLSGKMVARHTPDSSFGTVPFDVIAAASDAATKFSLSV